VESNLKITRTVRIERSALEDVLRRVAPVIRAGQCSCCGNEQEECSPPYVIHSNDCRDNLRYVAVRDLIAGGIAAAKVVGKKPRRRL